MRDPLASAAARLEHWCRTALAFWAEVQEPTGAWPEHLRPDGTPDRAAVRRHRVQARQVITYAVATRLGWFDGRDVVHATADFMWEAGRSESAPGLAHRLHPDGRIADGTRDLYDHAFYLLALGHAQALVGGQEARLAHTVALIDSLAHPSGGFRETLGSAVDAPRRQNPHMHLFEACLALHGLGVEGGRKGENWLERARDHHALFETHIFDPRHKAIREHFTHDWHWNGGTLEPGHACEWVWLLGEWERLTGEDTAMHRNALYQNALLSGAVWLRDATTHDFEPVRETSRLWVQTELVRAHAAQARHGVPGARGMLGAVVDGLLDGWLEPRGTWIDQRGACGQTLSDTIPTSTFYHIMGMAAEVADLAGSPA